jgi:phosphohistidine swiveling domain-containing protein
MKKEIQKLLKQNWKYYISRNIHLWHNEVSLLSNNDAFGLTKYLQLRVHDLTHSDFYLLHQWRYSREDFIKQLMVKIIKPDYIRSVFAIYKMNCQKLIKIATTTKSDFNSLKDFFDFYGACISMLDLTTAINEIASQKVNNLLRDYDNKLEILFYYSQPKVLAPIQRLEKDLDKLSGKKINILYEAKKLHKKYRWIPANFVEEPWPLDYFIKAIKNYHPSFKKSLHHPKINVSKETKYYLSLIADVSYLNEYRKEAFVRALLFVRPVLNRLAKKHGLKSWRDLNLLTSKEILDLALNKDDYQKGLINKRQSLFAIYNEGPDNIKFIFGKDVVRFENKFKKINSGLIEVKGLIANKGSLKGRVKIILTPGDFFKFKPGDILVAKSTSVDFVPIMKKAGAFVTDEGGLASHAAIISREYGKPCIIGTKIGTQVFKDGDLVEVDANKGIVKKL